MTTNFDLFPSRLINGDRVRQAREMLGLTQSDISSRLAISQAMVAHIEGGLKQPSREVAEAIARETSLPLNFFYRHSGPSLPQGSLLFRSRANVSAKKLTQAHVLAERVYEIYMGMAANFDLPPVSVRPIQGEPSSAAAEARRMLSLTIDKPIPHLIRAFEKAGGVVVTLPRLDDREAFAVWAGDRPVIGITGGLSGDRLRFSVAHEIGHLLLHQVRISRVQAEQDAHAFAAELLMPSSMLQHELETHLSLEGLAQLKLRWGVSIAALLRRAKDLGAIARRQYDRTVVALSARGWHKREPDQFDLPIEKPRALRQMAEALYGIPIHYESVAQSFDLPLDFVRRVLDSYAGYQEVMNRSDRSGGPWTGAPP